MPATTSTSRRIFTSIADLSAPSGTLVPPSTVAILAHLWVPPLILPAFTAVLTRGSQHGIDPIATIAYTAGAIAVYTGDRLAEAEDPTSACAGISRWIPLLATLACCAGVICVGGIIADWPSTGWISASLAGMSLGYPWLKRLPLLKTLVVVIAWTLALHGAAAATTWSRTDAAVALIIAATTMLCDLKDRRRDAERAIVTVATLLGSSGTRIFATSLLAVAACLAWWAAAHLLAIVSLAQVVPAWLRRTERPVIGSLVVDGSLVTAATIMAALAMLLMPPHQGL